MLMKPLATSRSLQQALGRVGRDGDASSRLALQGIPLFYQMSDTIARGNFSKVQSKVQWKMELVAVTSANANTTTKK